MKQYLTLILFLPAIISFGQDTTYYDIDGEDVSIIDSAYYYKIVQHDQTDSILATVKTFYKSGQLKTEAKYSDYKREIIDGVFKSYYENGKSKVKSNYNFGKLNGVYLEYFENGQLKVESNYKNGKLHEKFKEYFENGKLRKEIDYKEEKFNGMVLTYWKNGKSKRIAKYENDSLIIGECFDANGEKSLYFDYWIPATCSGGVKGFIEYLNYELHYPEYSRRKEIEGKVIVRFIVSEYGDISEIKVIQSVSKELDAEAIRVIKKMPKWEPSLLDGEPVRMSQLVPIVFKLTD